MTEAIARTKDQLASDIDHLRRIWTKLLRTEITIARGISAYEDSQILLAEINAQTALPLRLSHLSERALAGGLVVQTKP